MRRLFLTPFLFAALAHGQIAQQIVAIQNSASGSFGAFTLRTVCNGSISSGASSFSITINGGNCPKYTAASILSGSLVTLSLVGENNAANIPPLRISSTNIGGTLTQAVDASTGTYGASAVNDRLSNAYILPSTETGVSTTITVTLNATVTYGTTVYITEYVPSGSPSLVGMDIDAMLLPAAACTSCVSMAFTQSGTNDACIVGQTDANAYNLYPTAISSPYTSYPFFSSSGVSVAGFAQAITSSGTGPTWTEPSGIPVLSTMCFGWSPTAFVPQMNVSFETGTAGNVPTAATLSADTKGWNGALWYLAAIQLQYATGASMPLIGASNRLGDGSVIGTSSTQGLQIAATGTAQSDYIQDSFGYNTNNPNMLLSFKYNDNLAQTDTTLIDCGNLHGGVTDYAGVNCYGLAGNRIFRLETPYGNGSNITPSGGSTATACGTPPNGCTILVQYESGGAAITASSVTASVGGGTATFTGTFTASLWPPGFAFSPSCTGGTNFTGQLFYVVTSNATTVTTSSTGYTNGGVGAVASGTPTACTLTGQHVVSLYDKTGALVGVSFHSGSSTLTDYPITWVIGQFVADAITSGKTVDWDSVNLCLNLTCGTML